jgi:protein involved in polysaccharide export with SLBB domain
MSNHSFIHPRIPSLTPLCIALAGMVVFFASAGHAQCTGDDDPDSLACQIEQPEQSPAQTPDTPAVLTLSQSAQKPVRADKSTDASANGSLSNGEAFTEGAPSESRIATAAPGALAAPAQPATEFQRFVEGTTGKMLPIFGESMFAAQPASFDPARNAPAPDQLIVGAGDELHIRIWGQVNFSANLHVNPEGEIYLPKVGAVHVAGMPFSAIEGHLRTALDRIYRNFEISVDLGAIHSIPIYVTGRARRPGEYSVSSLSTLVDAIFLSGGPSAGGSMRHFELKRGGKTVSDFDFYALLLNGNKSGDIDLQPGDVLYIPVAGPQVALLGSVRQAGIYEMRGEETVAQLLEAAGGWTVVALTTRLSLERIEDHAQRRTLELAGDAQGLSTRLSDGDILRVDPITSNYRETVTLRGSLANPGHFRWHAGMRLSELIPDREALVTRGYWWHRTQLGLPAPELEPVSEQHTRTSAEGLEEKPAAVLSPGAQTDWNYAVIERLDPATMTTSLLPFDLGRLVLEHDASQDRELKPGDVITIFSQEDVHPPADLQTKYVRIDGEVTHAGIYSVLPGETLRSLVARAGGLTSKAYLFGAEFTRVSTRALEQQRIDEFADKMQHQLERKSLSLAGLTTAPGGIEQNPALSVDRALVASIRNLHASGRIVLDLSPQSRSLDELPDLALEDGDRLTIPTAPATVQVIGAVLNQNAFLYRKEARVDDYLHLAGGPSRDADRNREFVLRADGSVASQASNEPILASSSFDRARLYPGDTIVVPEKMLRTSAVNGIMAWTGILSQASLAAAVVSLMK